MKYSLEDMFCKLLRVALGLSQDFPYTPTEQEWQSLFTMAQQQSVLSVVYNAFARLPEESRPPRQLRLRYAAFVESKRGRNLLMNQDAARYTRLFEERGCRSVILKGQANARLYPDTLSRQAGDIDIWVPGGYDKVKQLLIDTGLILDDDHSPKVFRHIGFKNENGIEVEVHHRPSENLFRNREFQEVLLAEFENSTLTPEGFYAPSIRFALIMQLQHLYYHYTSEGVGFRHLMDYFVLLTHSTEADREFAWAKIKRFSLGHACAGVMWVLGKVFALPREQMLCPPDKRRGMRLYRETLEGGNFGRSAPRNQGKRSTLTRWFKNRLREFSWLGFDPLNTVLGEIYYWRNTISLIPERIKRRKMFL